MSQILILLDDKTLIDMLNTQLPEKYGAEVIIRNSSADAKSFLEILPEIDVLFCKDVIGKDRAALKMCEYLAAKQLEDPREVKVVVFGETAPDFTFVTHARSRMAVTKIVQHIGFLLGKEEIDPLVEEEALEKQRAQLEQLEFQKNLKLKKEKEERERYEREHAEEFALKKAQAEKEHLIQEQARLEREKEEKKRALEERIERGKIRQQKLEEEKIEKEKQELQRAEKERIALELMEKEKLEKGRLLAEKAEKEKIEKVKQELEKTSAELRERDRLLAEKAERERIFLEKEANLKLEKEKLQQEKNRLQQEKDRIAKELEDKVQAQKDKEVRERIERGKARIAQVAKEKSEAEALEREQAALEAVKKEKDRIELEKLKEKEMREKIARSKEKIASVSKGKVEEPDNEDAGEKTTVFRMPTSLKTAATPETAKVAGVEYKAISVIYFNNLTKLNFNFSAYGRIKKGNAFEYNKKISANVEIGLSELERILLRSGKELFIEQSEYSKASEFLNSDFLNQLRNPKLSLSERLKLNSDSFEILLGVFKNSSFDKYNIEVIKELIKSTGGAAGFCNGVKDVHMFFIKDQLSYGYMHMFVTYLTLIKVIDIFPWSKDQSKNKILYLALFHDLSLHSDKLIKLHHTYTPDAADITEEEHQIIASHAHASAEILEQIVKAPLELTSIIREHHGKKDGKGIPGSISFTTTPLTMAFVVVEDFVTAFLAIILKNKEIVNFKDHDEKFKDVFAEMKKKYTSSTYLDVMTEVEKFYFRTK